MPENQFRNKIYWFAFFYSILVIWVHSGNAELFLPEVSAVSAVARVEDFVGDSVAQIAVPGFFMISAYLFYRNFTWEKLPGKWFSRIRSVLVPFILWNGIYYMGYVIGSRLPVVSDVIGKGIVPLDLLTAADAILHYTYNYVFWYLYQLILLILLAPVIYLLLKNLYIGIAVLAVLFVQVQYGRSIPVLNLDALLYYSFAACAAIHGRRWAEAAWNKKTAAIGAGAAAFAILLYEIWGAGNLTAVVTLRLLIPPALWLMISGKRLGPAYIWMRQNFFLYATHFAIVRLVNKTAARFLSGSQLLPLVIYILMPVFVIGISYLFGKVLKRLTPGFWNLLNGGRTS